MEEKYNNYINAFKELTTEEKEEMILSDMEELLMFFTKINIDFHRSKNILPIEEDYENYDEFLVKLLMQIINLKEMSAETVNILLENFYEGEDDE